MYWETQKKNLSQKFQVNKELQFQQSWGWGGISRNLYGLTTAKGVQWQTE